MVRDKVFISYRRTDVPRVARWLFESLVDRYGASVVFFDTESISPGERFPRRLRDQLARSTTVLAVIGPDWAGRTESGSTKLHDPDDWVRLELSAVLPENDIEVIPVLVDGTPMPASDALPLVLRELVERNAISFRQGSGDQVDELITSRIDERIPPLEGKGEMARLRISVKEQLGVVVEAHAYCMWNLLLPLRDDVQFEFFPPKDFAERDVLDVHFVLQWLLDEMNRDLGWWRDSLLRSAAEATIWVASDLLDRIEWSDDDNGVSRALDLMDGRRRPAIHSLIELHDRQKDYGDEHGVEVTRRCIASLGRCEPLPAYLIGLDDYTRVADAVALLGERPGDFVRQETSWLIDHLRPDMVLVDRYGEPLGDSPPPPFKYRWGRLVVGGEPAEGAWESRFTLDSWFRRLVRTARERYPSGALQAALEPRD